jgi:hypothetical protein
MRHCDPGPPGVLGFGLDGGGGEVSLSDLISGFNSRELTLGCFDG